MNEWTNEWMKEWMNEWVNEWFIGRRKNIQQDMQVPMQNTNTYLKILVNYWHAIGIYRPIKHIQTEQATTIHLLGTDNDELENISKKKRNW